MATAKLFSSCTHPNFRYQKPDCVESMSNLNVNRKLNYSACSWTHLNRSPGPFDTAHINIWQRYEGLRGAERNVDLCNISEGNDQNYCEMKTVGPWRHTFSTFPPSYEYREDNKAWLNSNSNSRRLETVPLHIVGLQSDDKSFNPDMTWPFGQRCIKCRVISRLQLGLCGTVSHFTCKTTGCSWYESEQTAVFPKQTL